MEHSTLGHFLGREFDSLCEICGGQHFTECCDAYTRYGTQEELNAWCKAANEERDKEIKDFTDYLNSECAKNNGRYMYDSNFKYLGYQTASGEMILSIREPETLMEAVVHQALADKYFIPDYKLTNSGSPDSIQSYEDSYETSPLSCENGIMQDPQVKPETIMDVSVSPPVQLKRNYEFEHKIPDFENDKEVEDPDEVDVSNSTWFMLEKDKVVKTPSREEELTMEIKQSLDRIEDVVEGKEHHSRPMGKSEDELPPHSTNPREKARKRKLKDRNRLKVRGWCPKMQKETLKSVHIRSPHQMPRIRFGPGKFKYWWSDPFVNFKTIFNSINKTCINNKERKELNGLDRVCIKEKPPD